MVVHTSNVALGRLRQEDCLELRATLRQSHSVSLDKKTLVKTEGDRDAAQLMTTGKPSEDLKATG